MWGTPRCTPNRALVGGDNSLQSGGSLGALRVAWGGAEGWRRDRFRDPPSPRHPPERLVPSLQAGLAAAGLAWDGLRKELELPHTPLLGQLSSRRAEGSGRCVCGGGGVGGVWFGHPSQSRAPIVPAVGRWAGDRCRLSLNPWNRTPSGRQPLSHKSLVDWWHTPSNPSKCRIVKI